MTDREAAARAWEERQRELGCTLQAVLFRRFPGWLNGWLHRRHTRFVLRNLPPGAGCVLDAGCGWGRIALAVKQARPGVSIEGIEPCEAFAADFERRVGRCHRVAIQEFRAQRRYDAVLVVTLLMYLSESERARALAALWEALAPGGRMLCIEPAAEIEAALRRLLRRAGPPDATAGVRRFRRGELAESLRALPGAALASVSSIRLIPGVAAASLHHCVSVEKSAPGGPTSRSTA